MKHQEVLIAGHDDVGPAGDRHLEELIVFGIAADLDTILRINGFTASPRMVHKYGITVDDARTRILVSMTARISR